jgi:hypothetical protein
MIQKSSETGAGSVAVVVSACLVTTGSHMSNPVCSGHFGDGISWTVWLALKLNPPDLSLQSSQDYRCEPPVLRLFHSLNYSLFIFNIKVRKHKILFLNQNLLHYPLYFCAWKFCLHLKITLKMYLCNSPMCYKIQFEKYWNSKNYRRKSPLPMAVVTFSPSASLHLLSRRP